MKKIILIFLIILFNENTFADEQMKLGMDVYKNKAMCGTCHRLKAAESIGDIGPNLDMLKPQISQIIYAVTNGIGVMQPWSGILTVEEIDAVAYYVFTSTNKE